MLKVWKQCVVKMFSPCSCCCFFVFVIYEIKVFYYFEFASWRICISFKRCDVCVWSLYLVVTCPISTVLDGGLRVTWWWFLWLHLPLYLRGFYALDKINFKIAHGGVLPRQLITKVTRRLSPAPWNNYKFLAKSFWNVRLHQQVSCFGMAIRPGLYSSAKWNCLGSPMRLTALKEWSFFTSRFVKDSG